jgi:hypothetical protein
MTLPDLFDTPAQHRCPRCAAGVLRVHDNETGLSIDLQPHPLPVTRPLPTGRALFENHPRHGWRCQSSPGRNGYPIHLMHTCQPQDRKENPSHV